MTGQRLGVRVPVRHTARDTSAWVWVTCRFCGAEFECIEGLPAHRTLMCLWCYADCA